MIKKITLALLSLIMSSLSLFANFEKPDFAFPATVIEDANAVLESPQAKADGQLRLQALLQIVRATRDIGGDAVFALPEKIASVAERDSQADVRGLMLLLEARVYADIYRDHRYKYNNVTPAVPRPESIDEWSRDDFSLEVSQLVSRAESLLSGWYSAPLSDYTRVIETDSLSTEVFPCLRDFVWAQTKDLLNTFNQPSAGNPADLCPLGSAEWVWWNLNDDRGRSHDFNAVKAMLTEATDPDATALIHLSMLQAAHEEAQRLEAYLSAKKYLETAAESPFTAVLKKNLKGYLQASVSLRFPATVYPGEEIEFLISHDFASRVGVLVTEEGKDSENPVFERSVPTDSMSYNNVSTVKGKFDRPGVFRVFATLNQAKSTKYQDSSPLLVSPVLVTLVSSRNQVAWLVTDTRTGLPVEGIKVSAERYTGTSDKDGLIIFDKKQHTSSDVLITLKDGTSIRLPEKVYISESREEEIKSTCRATILFSRPLYRPGETLDCAVIVSKVEKSESAPYSDEAVSLRLYNASGSLIATDTLTTDPYGRANTSFQLPKDAMAGRFRVEASTVITRHAGSQTVMVSEYKRPVFELLDVAASFTDSTLVIKGRAERYTGAPVAAGQVMATFGREYWRSEPQKLTKTVDINPDGQFEIKVPLTELIAGNYYSIELEAVATSGDMASYALSLMLEPQPALSANTPSFDAATQQLLAVRAQDGAGNRHFPEVEWCLSTDGKEIARGKEKLTADGLKVNWKKLPAGQFNLNLRATGCIACETEIMVYNTARNLVPESVTALIPETNFTVAPGESARVKIGVPQGSQVYIFNIDSENSLKMTRQAVHTGFNTINLDGQTGVEKTYLVLTLNGVNSDQTVLRIRTAEKNTKTWLKGEAWRDNIMPGTPQHWSLRFSDSDSSALAGAVVATMYNRALESFAPGQWASLDRLFNTAVFVESPYANNMWNKRAYVYRYTNYNYRDYLNIQAPEFRYLAFRQMVMMEKSSMRYMATAGAPMAYDSNAAGEMMDMVESVEAENDGAIAEEAAPAEAPAAPAETATPTNAPLRNAEIMQIFWRPEIVTDNDGVARIDFDMPDAIGSWRFSAVAWDMEGRTANLSAVLESSKPVTIEGNAPRFLRAGDDVLIPATIINRTAEAVTATVILEAFNIATGEVISSHTENLELGGGTQAIVSLPVRADGDLPMIGFRARVSACEFTDGEQSVIPVLEAAVRTFDSSIFYLDSNETRLEIDIPADASGSGKVALHLCANPIWDVIKALPALYDFKPQSSLGAVNALFGAQVGAGIAQKYPEVADVVSHWTENPADSALVSPLRKNEDLKMIVLGSTPFVGAADYMTQQMEQLSMTLDPQQTSEIATTALEVLQKLQQPDGGFCWVEWNPESSVFVTQYVVQVLGRLNRLGFLTADCNRMVEAAFSYLDSNMPAVDAAQYAFLNVLFPDIEISEEGKAKIAEGVKDIRKNWRNASPTIKALDAMILKHNGYEAEARQIIRSIGEFAVPSPTLGLEIPSTASVDSYAAILEATAEVVPNSPMIDGLRKWLVLKTQTTDDLGAWNPTELIAVMLATGSRWTTLGDGDVTVKIDGKAVEADAVEYATGTLTLHLPGATAPRRVEITRASGLSYPAYGSVLSIGTAMLDSVKPSDCSELIIRKSLLAEKDGKWVATDTFTPGQKVKVQLMLKSTRELEYVTISDARPAGFEPIEQMPGRITGGNVWGYRTNGVCNTDFFIGYLPRGVNYIEYETIAGHSGEIISGVATVQSQYAPEFTARSGASKVVVTDKEKN